MTTERRRLYQLAYPTGAKRPVYLEDSGNALAITGIVVEGMGLSVTLLAPWSAAQDTPPAVPLTLVEWQEFLRISDDPKVFEVEPNGSVKAVHRKSERAASGVVQQQVWARDGFQCMYCGRKMGEVLLTIDHFVPLEMGGSGETSNLVSACGRCNKLKGDRDPREFCESEGCDYFGLQQYLDGRASRVFLAHLVEKE